MSYKRRQNTRRVKKDDPKKSYPIDHVLKDAHMTNEIYEEFNNEVKNAVMQMINKFV